MRQQLLEREVRAAIAYAQASLEPGVGQVEAVILLGLAKRRIIDAAKAAQMPELPGTEQTSLVP